MATQSSGNLSPSQTYKLGNYTFAISMGSSGSNSTIRCSVLNGGSSSKKTITVAGTNYKLTNWKVSANANTGTVYAYWTRTESPITPSPFTKPVPHAGSCSIKTSRSDVSSGYYYTHYLSWSSGGGQIATVKTHTMYRVGTTAVALFASADPTAKGVCRKVDDQTGESSIEEATLTGTYTYDGRTVYYNQYELNLLWGVENAISSTIGWVNDGEVFEKTGLSAGAAAWYIVYGVAGSMTGAAIVGRFVIEADEADETSWDDPGCTGETTKTLYLTVNGALSGRHNDPLNDTSYNYLPADQDDAVLYGSGGIGGFGGGGGAGASSIIVYTIGTDRAGSVDVTTVAKRHGYGSGGGKGGKGGPGCILVYY